MKCSPTSKRTALLESVPMAAKKGHGAYDGRNKFKHFSLRPDEEGQREHWEAFAKSRGWDLSELIRRATDKFTGFVSKKPKK